MLSFLSHNSAMTRRQRSRHSLPAKKLRTLFQYISVGQGDGRFSWPCFPRFSFFSLCCYCEELLLLRCEIVFYLFSRCCLGFCFWFPLPWFLLLITRTHAMWYVHYFCCLLFVSINCFLSFLKALRCRCHCITVFDSFISTRLVMQR